MSNIVQGTPEWLEAKQKTIGASEIYTLVHHYCRSELEKIGLELGKEQPFRTIQELFLKIKFDAKLSQIDPVYSEFGNGMEPYVAYRLGQELPQLKIERSKDFIVNEKLHPLTACSPDGYIELPFAEIGEEMPFLSDFDKTCKISAEWGFGALEIKTANYFANFNSDQGAKLQYIFQHQYQMMVMGLKWGIIAVLMPKEKEFDEPFFKGKVLGTMDIMRGFVGIDLSELKILDQYYDLRYYVYPELPVFQSMIMKALNAFQADLDTYDINQSTFPRNSEDLSGLQREKKIWAQLWSDRFGTLEVSGEHELNYLLNQRHDAKVASMFADQELIKLENELAQKSGKYCEVKGSEQRLIWTKNGQLRFYKNK